MRVTERLSDAVEHVEDVLQHMLNLQRVLVHNYSRALQGFAVTTSANIVKAQGYTLALTPQLLVLRVVTDSLEHLALVLDSCTREALKLEDLPKLVRNS